MLAYGALFGIIISIPFLLQIIMLKSAAVSGLVMLPMSLAMILGGNVGGILSSKLQKYRLLGITGFSIALTGMIILSIAGININIVYLIISVILLGFGIGITFPIYNISPQAVFPLLFDCH